MAALQVIESVICTPWLVQVAHQGEETFGSDDIGKAMALRCSVCNGDGHVARSCPIMSHCLKTNEVTTQILPAAYFEGILYNIMSDA